MDAMEREPPPSMLRSILDAARTMFPGQDWRTVEEHVRRAWNSVVHDHAWERVRESAQREWERESPGS